MNSVLRDEEPGYGLGTQRPGVCVWANILRCGSVILKPLGYLGDGLDWQREAANVAFSIRVMRVEDTRMPGKWFLAMGGEDHLWKMRMIGGQSWIIYASTQVAGSVMAWFQAVLLSGAVAGLDVTNLRLTAREVEQQARVQVLELLWPLLPLLDEVQAFRVYPRQGLFFSRAPRVGSKQRNVNIHVDVKATWPPRWG
jgi:hypothetical protein